MVYGESQLKLLFMKYNMDYFGNILANKNPAQITEGLSRVKLLMDTEYKIQFFLQGWGPI